jgi:hypothetical protein
MTEFTPGLSLAGGVLIGAAAVMLMLMLGRIAGVAGIASRLIPPVAEGWDWRVAFVAGMFAAPLVTALALETPLPHSVPDNLPLMAVAGVLVGFGSVLGSGCTSGHGVCGIPRLSMRSILSTLVYMAAGFVTVAVVRHGLGG